MAELFFRLRYVSEDEAADVRRLLDDNRIPYYETTAGRFGISFPAIWLQDDADCPRARALLDTYQQERALRLQLELAEARARNEHDTLFRRALRHPLRILLAVVGISFILYVSISPFFRLSLQ